MKKLLLAFTLLISGAYFAQAQNCPQTNSPGIHIVQKGQTVYRISKMYGVTVDQLASWNNRGAWDLLPICTPLRVSPPSYSTTTQSSSTTTYTPPPPASTTTTTSSTTYVENTKGTGRYSKPFAQYKKQEKGVHYVEDGENIANIARLYGYTLERFSEFNGIGAGQEVTTGQVLRTTDCSCLNTVTDRPDEKVDPNSIRPAGAGAGTTYTGGTTTTTTSGTGTTYTGGTTTTSTSTSTSRPTAGAKPTKAKAAYMNNEELQMIDEINLLRSNPNGYIPYVQEYISELQKNGSFGNSIETARELILELQQTPALSILEPKQCVFTAAQKHGMDEKSRGSTGHMGSDNSWPWDRVLRECPSLSDGNENLVGGPDNIRRSVMLLLVDDGIPNRGHRKTLLNPAWKYVGCYKVGTVNNMPNCWVQNFAY